MTTNRGRVITGVTSQVMAQAVTGWALLAHLAHWPDVSIWLLAPLGAAALVPFRHDGTFRDRATGNFGAALVVGGMFWWEATLGGLEGIVGGSGFTIGLVGLLMLVSTVLFALAGAMFWVLRPESDRR